MYFLCMASQTNNICRISQNNNMEHLQDVPIYGQYFRKTHHSYMLFFFKSVCALMQVLLPLLFRSLYFVLDGNSFNS